MTCSSNIPLIMLIYQELYDMKYRVLYHINHLIDNHDDWWYTACTTQLSLSVFSLWRSFLSSLVSALHAFIDMVENGTKLCSSISESINGCKANVLYLSISCPEANHFILLFQRHLDRPNGPINQKKKII